MAKSKQRANDKQPSPGYRPHRWDTFGVVIASLVGLLALLVSGYTAWIQRQQVRAEVWPYLLVAYQVQEHKLTVFNKGVGPAIVEDVRVTVDGKPQPNWRHVFDALGLSKIDSLSSTLTGAVLSPGDRFSVLEFPEEAGYTRFRKAMSTHGLMNICYCSTLDECWMFEDHHPPAKPVVRPLAQCPNLSAAEAFRD